MGDILLKQRFARAPQWHQSTEMLARKPWPPVYAATRTGPRHNFHPPDGIPWEPPPYAPRYSKDYYCMAPYYRNVMPPPPNPSRMAVMDRRKAQRRQEAAPCHCKSRSLEDVRVAVVEGDWDFNGNKVMSRQSSSSSGSKGNRRSVENLISDVGYRSPRRFKNYQVGSDD